jgi:hypothetical protein
MPSSLPLVRRIVLTVAFNDLGVADRFEPDSKPAAFLDETVYNKTGKIGGMDSEGETIGLWRPSGRE